MKNIRLKFKTFSGFLHNNSIMGGGYGHSNTATSQQNAYAEEKQSVSALLCLISKLTLPFIFHVDNHHSLLARLICSAEHTCEVLSLWKILCEHQFNLLFSALPADEQSILAAYTFRDLVLSRGETCALLIASLINSYLCDNATVGSISSKLRDVCPNLYRQENAVLHKVHTHTHTQHNAYISFGSINSHFPSIIITGNRNTVIVQKLHGCGRTAREIVHCTGVV